MNVSQFCCFLYILKRARCLSKMGVIVNYIYAQSFFLRDVFIFTKRKRKKSFLRKEFFFRAQIPRALLSNKNGILHF